MRDPAHMPLIDLPDEVLERAARAARLAAGLHERSARKDKALRHYFSDQADRYRSLAAQLENVRKLAQGDSS